MVSLLILLLTFSGGSTEPPPLHNDAEYYYTPFDVLNMAYKDTTLLQQSNSNIAVKEVRYLSLHVYAKKERKTKKAVVDFLLNSFSPNKLKLTRTASLPADSDDPVVLRINLRDYDISVEAWDNLATKGSGPVPIPDPYFHQITDIVEAKTIVSEPSISFALEESTINKTTATISIKMPADGILLIDDKKVEPIGEFRVFTATLPSSVIYNYTIKALMTIDGNQYAITGKVDARNGYTTTVTLNYKLQKSTGNKIRTQTASPLLAIEADTHLRGSTITNLITTTGTKNPILQADWFIAYASWAPIYYEMIGLKLKDNPDKEDAKKNPKVFLEADFQKLFKFDRRLAEEDLVASIADTKIVTLHNRILLRFSTTKGTTGGYYWQSEDTDKGIDDEDYLKNLSTFNKARIKAKEIITSGRNRLQFYALANDKGVLLDAAATNIAQHGDVMPTKWQDKTVFSGRNCMLCHGNGLIYIKDKVRNIARGKIALFIADKTKDQEIARRIEEAFFPNVNAIIDEDSAKFKAAVLAACGLDSKAITKEFEESVWHYLYQDVTLEQMAREVGIPPVKLKALLSKAVNVDESLTGVLQDPPEYPSRLIWESRGYAVLVNYLITQLK